MATILEATDLTCRYGGFTALSDFSLRIDEGQCICVVGPNGAGKTTLLSHLAGLYGPAAGRIRWSDEDVTRMDAEARSRLGISLVPERRRIFGSMTVRENLELGATLRRGQPGVADDQERMLTYFPILRERFRSSAGKLSGGEQQMLAIARALMSRPKLLMIDEPSLGLAPLVIDKVYEVLKRLRGETGLTMLIVEQSTARVSDIADHVHVIRTGRRVWAGSIDGPGGLAQIDKAYFGFEATAENG